MTLRRIQLIEHQATVQRLAPAEVHDLLGLAAGALDITPTMDSGTFRIKASSKVGMIRIPGIEVLIRPKISLENVFLLIEPARVPIELRSELVGFGTFDEITPAFAAFFTRMLEQTLARGLRRDYLAREEELVAVRGRINVARQIRSPTATPLVCNFEEHSLDTPHNRILKAASLCFVRLPAVGDKTRGELRHLLTWFGDVGDSPPPVASVLRRGFTRLDSYYEPVVRLAALVLEGTSLRDRFGEATASTFLIDMNKVFETFVESRLSTALAGRLVVRSQASLHLDSDRRVRIRPDLVFERHAQAVYVGDTKYTLSGGTFGVESDLYQLLAYTTALSVTEGVLIYAHDGGEVPPRSIRVRNANKELLSCPLERVHYSGVSAVLMISPQ